MALQSVDHNITDIEEPLLAKLLLTLEEMVKRYQRLLPVIQQEKRLMIEGNLNDLIPCLSEKEGLLGELKQLEERRLRQIDPLVKRFAGGSAPGRVAPLAGVASLAGVAPLAGVAGLAPLAGAGRDDA